MTPPVTAKIARPAVTEIEDVQGRADTRRLPINRVGIKDIRHPVRVKDRSAGEQHTIANFNMYVSLPHNFKGTHMSRFVEILHAEREISVESFRTMLENDRAAGGRRRAYRDELPVLRHEEGAGVRRREPDGLPGEPHRRAPRRPHGDVGARGGAGHEPVPVLEEDLGVRRSQPALARHHQGEAAHHMWIEELIEIAESEASCELYGILKRPDEKYVTERAYDNPKFVEDMVRDVAARLNADERIAAYVVESENFESIHNHSAYALDRAATRTPNAVLRLRLRPPLSARCGAFRALQPADE